MPSKRPAPLSDNALCVGKAGVAPVVEVVQGSLGETNDGVPLPVKNTFIDVPSNLTPTMQTQSRAQLLNTAPAELNFTPGFIKRAVLASSTVVAAVAPKSPVDIGPNVPCSASSPRQRSNIGVPVQRPTKESVPGLQQPPSTPPLETPSPTGKALFSSCRYQLFGGPAPVQEATHSTFAAPAAAQFSQTNVVSPADIRRASAESLPESLVKERDGEDDEDDSDEDEQLKQAQKQAASGVTRVEDAPKPPPGAAHPSLGSDVHDEGTCKRCCFFPRNRCLNGYNCEFCHYDHEKRKRKSKKKKKKDKEGANDTSSEATRPSGLLLGPPTELVGSAFHSGAESLLYPPSGMPASHLRSQAVPPMATHVWVDESPPSYPSSYPGFEYLSMTQPSPYQALAGGLQVAATVSSPSYFAAATGSSVVGSEVDNVQYLGTQPVAPPPPYMGYQPPPELLSAALHDPSLYFPPPYEDPLSYLTPAAPPTLATTPALRGPWAPPIEAPPSLSPPTLATTPAPPSEAPRLPHEVSGAKDKAPPTEAPRALPQALSLQAPPSFSPCLPPSWEPSEPPPMCSPKLPKDIEFCLDEVTEILPDKVML